MGDLIKEIDICLENQCYIYPSGGCAAAIVNILKDCFLGMQFIMLDDSKAETSLQAFCQEIQASENYLLLCAGDIQEELLQKCKKYGITKVIDGRVYTALILAKKIKEQITQQQQKFEFLENGRVLHIFENKWITHLYYFYDIFSYYLDDMSLLIESVRDYCASMQICNPLEKGILLTYSEYFPLDSLSGDHFTIYFGDLDFYQKNKHNVCGNHKILICPWILLDFFINREVFFSGGSLLFPLSQRKITKVGYGHSLCEAFQFFPKRYKKQCLVRYIKRYFSGFDYYFAIDKVSKESFKQIFKNCGVSTSILKGGSLSLDFKGECYNNAVEGFMFIPRLNGVECKEVIEALLEKQKRVIVRLHPACLEYSKQYAIMNPYAYLDDFKKYKHFSIDTLVPINQELLSKSIVITDNSSVSYSAPLSTLRPCILFAPPKKEFDLRIKNFNMSFDNPILHRVALDVDSCVNVALQLEQELVAGGGHY